MKLEELRFGTELLKRGFAATMEDFYAEPERIHRVLDMIVDFKLQQCDELRRRFGDRLRDDRRDRNGAGLLS